MAPASAATGRKRQFRGFIRAFGYYWRQTRRGVTLRLGPRRKTVRIYVTIDGRYTLRVNGRAHSHNHASREAAMRVGMKAAGIPFLEEDASP